MVSKGTMVLSVLQMKDRTHVGKRRYSNYYEKRRKQKGGC